MTAQDRPSSTGDDHELRSFGRRRGRKRSPRQERIFNDGLARWGIDLERPAPTPLTGLFGSETGPAVKDIREVWLEIGFGGAEHLIAQAGANPGVGIIGAEPFEDGVVKALTAITERDLVNVRVHANDVRPLLRWLPAASIARTFILFPDPWPKARHAKRRLVSLPLLDLLDRVMTPGGRLRIATDIASYAGAILETVERHGAFAWTAARPGDWLSRPADWPATRYQAKAVAAGRKPYFFEFAHGTSQNPGKK